MMFLFKKAMLPAVLVISLLFASGLAYLLLNQDQIQRQLIDAVNKRIDTPISGDVSISLIKSFPNVALLIEDVQVEGSLKNKKEHLLTARSLALNLDFWSLLTKAYTIHSIAISDGSLYIERDKEGMVNYRFVKNNEQAPDTLPNVFSIEEALLQNVDVVYIDEYGRSTTDIRFFVEKGKLQGDFSKEHLNLSARMDARIAGISLDRSQLFKDRPVQLQLQLTSDTENGIFHIARGKLKMNRNDFSIDGTIVSSREKDEVDLRIAAQGKNLENLLSLLPEEQRRTVEGFSGSGNYHFVAEVRGDVSGKENPELRIEFGVKNGNIRSSKIKGELKGVELTGVYSNGTLRNGRSSTLSIPGFSATLKGNELSGTLQVANFKDPKYTIHLNGDVDLANIAELVTDSLLTDLSGSLAIQNFHFVGRQRDLDDIANSRLSGSGTLKFDDVGLVYNAVEYKRINGMLTFDRDQIEADHFMIQFLNTDLEFTGRLQNFIEYVLNLARNRDSKGTPLIAHGNLIAQQIDLKAIMEGYSMRGEPDQDVRNSRKITLQKVHNMQGMINANVALLVQERLEFENIRTNLVLSPSLITIEKVSTQTMLGTLEGKGTIGFEPGNTIRINLACKAEDVDIKTMFYQCDNFGQQVLNADHLNGRLTTDFELQATWEHFNRLAEDQLTAKADLEIRQGRLVNFEPINVLSRYIRLEELQDIQFSTIRNQINIRNRVIEIPAMEIESSVLNLTTYGQHDFDNYIDYHFKVNLKALLAKKFSRKRTKVKEGPQPEGNASLFISMKGPMMNPDVRYDKEAVKQKIKQDFKNEKEELKDLFTKEKNKPKEDPSIKAKETEAIFFEVEDELEYIEWEEDTISLIDR